MIDSYFTGDYNYHGSLCTYMQYVYGMCVCLNAYVCVCVCVCVVCVFRPISNSMQTEVYIMDKDQSLMINKLLKLLVFHFFLF